jgi:hypothetical protein
MALLALLEFGTLWFWFAALIPFLILIALVENERSGWAMFTVIATFVALVSLGNLNWLDWIVHHPLTIIGAFVAYVLAGMGWGVAKWSFYVAKLAAKYETYKAEFISKHGALTDETVSNEIRKNRGYNSNELTNRDFFKRIVGEKRLSRPNLAANRGRIMFWMSYWPASAVWTLLNDPITHLYRIIYAKMIRVFEGITNSMFKQYDKDLAA